MLADVVHVSGRQAFAYCLYLFGGVGAFGQVFRIDSVVFLEDGHKGILGGLPRLLGFVERGIEVASFHYVVIHRSGHRQCIAGESHDSDVLEHVQGLVAGRLGKDDCLYGQGVACQCQRELALLHDNGVRFAFGILVGSGGHRCVEYQQRVTFNSCQRAADSCSLLCRLAGAEQRGTCQQCKY